MQTIFIEENLHHQQIVDLCKYIELNSCSTLEFRRCKINDSDFDLLMKSLSTSATMILSLIFNIQMIDDQQRYKKFLRMLMHCSNLLHLQVHGNSIDDEMFALLHSILYEYCPKLILLDIGDNRLTNKSIVHLCSLINADGKRTGLEELIVSANISITNSGWTELFFAISFNSHLQRLALDYNTLDDSLAAMLSMIIASSRTLISIDLEGCQLTEYGGQLILGLLTKYPVTLEEIYLNQNPGIFDSTRTLIQECLNLKSRRNSVSSENKLSFRLPLSELMDSGSSMATEGIKPIKKEKKIIKPEQLRQSTPVVAKDSVRSVTFEEKDKQGKHTQFEQSKYSDEDDVDIDELLPIDIQPYGIAQPRPYWQRT